MAEEEDKLLQFEAQAVLNTKAGADRNQVRRTIADVYTFVRSRELNKTISSFTLDHYIDEAKRRIKEPRVLRSASNPAKGVGTRASQLTLIEKLEEEFSKAIAEAEKIAASVGREPK